MRTRLRWPFQRILGHVPAAVCTASCRRLPVVPSSHLPGSGERRGLSVTSAPSAFDPCPLLRPEVYDSGHNKAQTSKKTLRTLVAYWLVSVLFVQSKKKIFSILNSRSSLVVCTHLEYFWTEVLVCLKIFLFDFTVHDVQMSKLFNQS